MCVHTCLHTSVQVSTCACMMYVCMFVHACVHTQVYMCMCVQVCMCVDECASVYVHMHACVGMCALWCVYTCRRVCAHMHVSMCVSMCMQVHVSLLRGEVGAGCYTFILEAQIPLRNEIDIIPNRTPEPRENFKKHLKFLIFKKMCSSSDENVSLSAFGPLTVSGGGVGLGGPEEGAGPSALFPNFLGACDSLRGPERLSWARSISSLVYTAECLFFSSFQMRKQIF